MDREKLIKGIQEYLDDKNEVIAAYLYGSTASEIEGRESDLDIALLTHPFRDKVESYKARIRYLQEIQRIVDRNVDISLLQEAGELLAYQILKKGKVIFERDRRSHISFAASKLLRCLDFQQIERRMQKGMITGMRRKKHG